MNNMQLILQRAIDVCDNHMSRLGSPSDLINQQQHLVTLWVVFSRQENAPQDTRDSELQPQPYSTFPLRIVRRKLELKILGNSSPSVFHAAFTQATTLHAILRSPYKTLNDSTRRNAPNQQSYPGGRHCSKHTLQFPRQQPIPDRRKLMGMRVSHPKGLGTRWSF